MLQGLLSTPEIVKEFALAGNATFTIRSVASHARFTYRVRRCKDNDTLYFVSLMNGPDNESSYSYLGTIRNGVYQHGRKARIAPTASSAIAMQWFWNHISANNLPLAVECWHEGRCGRCNRKLTVPESIERGIGPECATRM